MGLKHKNSEAHVLVPYSSTPLMHSAVADGSSYVCSRICINRGMSMPISGSEGHMAGFLQQQNWQRSGKPKTAASHSKVVRLQLLRPWSCLQPRATRTRKPDH